MRSFIILFFHLFLPICIQAQIAGKVMNAKGEGVEFANVSLHTLPDSTIVLAQLTDIQGEFSFPAPTVGVSFYLQASQIGFTTGKSNIFTLPAQNAFSIVLQESEQTLGGVTLTGRRALVEIQGDKVVMNVEKSILATGLSASEILKRAPGVTQDQDGKLSLKGKQQVMVLLDGKPTYLNEEQVGRLLKSLPANQIASIEISTAPSVRYDAEGNAGMIDIRLKRGVNLGFNGTLTLSAGHGWFGKQMHGLYLNYRRGVVSTSLNYDFGNNPQLFILKSTRALPTGEVLAQNSYYRAPEFTHNLKYSLDIQLSKRWTTGAQFQGMYFSNKWNGGNETRLTDGLGGFQRNVTTDYSHDFWQNYTGNVFLKYQKDTLAEWTFDADFVKYDQQSPQGFLTRFYNQVGEEFQKPYILESIIPTLLNVYALKTDYIRHLPQQHKLEFGAKATWVNSDNDMRFYTVEDGVRVPNQRTNYFVYEENILAAYANFSGNLPKITYQLGLRTEQTHTKGTQKTINQAFTRDYWGFFPRVNITYQLTDKQNISLSYNRRIDRPEYQKLNPFVYFLDIYSSEAGNPFLKPQFTNNFELAYVPTEWLQISLNYTQTTDAMAEVIKQNDATKEAIFTLDNFGKYENLGVSITAGLPVTSFWEASAFVNVYKNIYSGNFNNLPLLNQAWSFTATTNHTFTLPKQFSLEIGAMYASPSVMGISKMRDMGFVSAGIQKKWGQNITLKLNCNDIFWTQVFRNTTNFGNLNTQGEYRFDNRITTFTFVYNFGKKLFDDKPARKTASEEEKERMKK